MTRLKGLFRGPRGGGRGGAQKVLRVMAGFKGIRYPIGPSGWFDGSSVDS